MPRRRAPRCVPGVTPRGPATQPRSSWEPRQPFTDNFGKAKLSVMSTRADFYSTEEAARLLGVSQRRVQQMLDAGELTRVARGLVDATSADRYRGVAQGARTRVWAEHTAWGAIALLSGIHADWIGPVQASRLRGTLREIASSADLVARTRDRATVRTFTGHSTARTRLQNDLVSPETVALGLVDVPSERIDGYLPADELDSTVRWLGLREDTTGEITLRVTGFDINVIRDLATAQTPVLAALDAATSLDPRERGVGERTLSSILDRYRR